MKLNNTLFVLGLIAIAWYAWRLLNGGGSIGSIGSIGRGIEGFQQGTCEDKTMVFMTAAATAKFLRSDPDQYVDNMTPWDLYARKAKTNAAYSERAASAAKNWTTSQEAAFAKAAKDADAFLLSKGHEIIENIKWVFALTDGSAYEDGMPHTRTNIIFVSSNTDVTHETLVRTLVHEKLHLFQRAYPEKMAQLLQETGFVRWKYRVGEPRIRANPDLDPWIYIDPKTKKPMAAYYSSDEPTSISDISSSSNDEHPFERMAYELAAS